MMPKYEFITPNLALMIMQEIKRMLIDPELIEILEEKETETKLPFDALRDLCSRFERNFSDEHCAFITASYLTEIDHGMIFINFKEFMSDLKDPRGKEMEGSRHRANMSAGSDASEELKKKSKTSSGIGSPLSEILNRTGGSKGLGRSGKKFDEEHMLDVSEAIFMKMADLMQEKGRSVRGIFTKYSEPEVFPDRTVLDLLSPGGFIEGIRETGIDDLQEFEVACLMRVLAKPELDNAVILNEFVMIMENFGVMDHMDDEDNDDYISDTQQSISQSIDQNEESKEKEGSKKEEAKTATKDATEKKNEADDEDVKKQNDKASKDIEEDKEIKEEIEEEKKASSPEEEEEKDKAKEGEAANNKSKRKPRQHNLANIDAKGVKILRKLARFLLKQFLHPREFFGKAVTKEHIKTKKR